MMKEDVTPPPAETERQPATWPLRLDLVLRYLPIRWRILSIAILNTLAAVLLAVLVWNGASQLAASWRELRTLRDSERLLVRIESEAGQLQSLIHRYFNQPTWEVFQDIDRRRKALLEELTVRAVFDAPLADDLTELVSTTERFLLGYDELRKVRNTISETYEKEVLDPAQEISGLYAMIDSATENSKSLIWPSLGKSREAFSSTLVSANAYFLSVSPNAVAQARSSLETVDRTIPVMLDLAETNLQRYALNALRDRAKAMRDGLDRLSSAFAEQSRLLSVEIDGGQARMAIIVNRLTETMRSREDAAQMRFDEALGGVLDQFVLVGSIFLALSVLVGVLAASSIRAPLADLMAAMQSIVAGDLGRRVRGLSARDEIGSMARSVEVFRENAIAKRQAEDELRASRDRAEATLAELRDAQQNLIEAEKLAALGGLVAGVAHEVNNPVGISLTVASALARRSEVFAEEVRSGQVRRSSLGDFVEGAREAAAQLVANLQRAGDLIQAFKQVAVDRSHAERRVFDLKESTEQIVASLKPGLRSRPITLLVEVPPGIAMDSYPGSYGQVLTNLVLNAAMHAFPDDQPGDIRVKARQLDEHEVEVDVIDTGVGMPFEVQRRAFEPFFTTRRGSGGTGLGLHIVYNIVTARLGGRISLTSRPGGGTQFRLILPIRAADAAESAVQRRIDAAERVGH